MNILTLNFSLSLRNHSSAEQSEPIKRISHHDAAFRSCALQPADTRMLNQARLRSWVRGAYLYFNHARHRAPTTLPIQVQVGETSCSSSKCSKPMYCHCRPILSYHMSPDADANNPFPEIEQTTSSKPATFAYQLLVYSNYRGRIRSEVLRSHRW